MATQADKQTSRQPKSEPFPRRKSFGCSAILTDLDKPEFELPHHTL